MTGTASQACRGSLSGKVAFVSGGSEGLNFGLARSLAEAGATLALSSRSSEKVDAAVARLRDEGHIAIGAPADVRDRDAVDAAFDQARDQLGLIDIVVAGAAGNFLAPALGLSTNGFRTIVDIDLIGTFNVFRASYDHLARPGAALIAMSAVQAVQPKLHQSHACAAKAGVEMLVRCLALEWGEYGIRVNAIAPGPVAGTEGVARLVRDPAALAARIPLRRFANAQDIGDLAVFLAGDLSRYITGAIVPCDGGLALGDASAGSGAVDAEMAGRPR